MVWLAAFAAYLATQTQAGSLTASPALGTGSAIVFRGRSSPSPPPDAAPSHESLLRTLFSNRAKPKAIWAALPRCLPYLESSDFNVSSVPYRRLIRVLDAVFECAPADDVDEVPRSVLRLVQRARFPAFLAFGSAIRHAAFGADITTANAALAALEALFRNSFTFRPGVPDMGVPEDDLPEPLLRVVDVVRAFSSEHHARLVQFALTRPGALLDNPDLVSCLIEHGSDPNRRFAVADPPGPPVSTSVFATSFALTEPAGVRFARALLEFGGDVDALLDAPDQVWPHFAYGAHCYPDASNLFWAAVGYSARPNDVVAMLLPKVVFMPGVLDQLSKDPGLAPVLMTALAVNRPDPVLLRALAETMAPALPDLIFHHLSVWTCADLGVDPVEALDAIVAHCPHAASYIMARNANGYNALGHLVYFAQPVAVIARVLEIAGPARHDLLLQRNGNDDESIVQTAIGGIARAAHDEYNADRVLDFLLSLNESAELVALTDSAGRNALHTAAQLADPATFISVLRAFPPADRDAFPVDRAGRTALSYLWAALFPAPGTPIRDLDVVDLWHSAGFDPVLWRREAGGVPDHALAHVDKIRDRAPFASSWNGIPIPTADKNHPRTSSGWSTFTIPTPVHTYDADPFAWNDTFALADPIDPDLSLLFSDALADHHDGDRRATSGTDERPAAARSPLSSSGLHGAGVLAASYLIGRRLMPGGSSRGPSPLPPPSAPSPTSLPFVSAPAAYLLTRHLYRPYAAVPPRPLADVVVRVHQAPDTAPAAGLVAGFATFVALAAVGCYKYARWSTTTLRIKGPPYEIVDAPGMMS